MKNGTKLISELCTAVDLLHVPEIFALRDGEDTPGWNTGC